MVFYYNWPVFDENIENYVTKKAACTTSRIQNTFANFNCSMKLLIVPAESSLRMTIILSYALYEHIRESQSYICNNEEIKKAQVTGQCRPHFASVRSVS